MTTLCTNLSLKATTQLTNYQFNSMCNFNGVSLGTDGEGLHKMCCGSSDDSTEIDASFTTAATDFGIQNNKRIWGLYIGHEADGDLQVELIADGTTIRTEDIPQAKDGQQRVRVKVGRGGYGRWYQHKFSNTEGCDFSIDSVQDVPIVLNQGHE